MTYEEVKKIRNNGQIEHPNIRELQELIDIAIEKQIPKKPLPTKGAADMFGANEPLWGEGECPNCKHYIRLPHKYCYKCGQAIDWSEEE